MMTKFNVGDKVRVTAKDESVPYGTVLTVAEGPHGSIRGGNYYFREIGDVVLGDNLELAENKPKKSARITALESQVATLQAQVKALESAGQYPLTAKFERESTSNCEVVDAILADIERKAKPTLEALLATYPPQQTRVLETPNQLRWGTIQRAKAYVAKMQPLSGRKITYVVNADKRTVVALSHRISFGCTDGVYAKGIAKCDPDDVFNADIGKAIALARALGVNCPTEFVKAVQPTEFVLGHRLYVNPNYPNELVAERTGKHTVGLTFIKRHENDGETRITDDTHTVYE